VLTTGLGGRLIFEPGIQILQVDGFSHKKAFSS
jgi:hypothetical protein